MPTHKLQLINDGAITGVNRLQHAIDSNNKMSFSFKKGGTSSTVGGETITNNFVEINGDILPSSNNTYNIGSGNARVKEVFVSESSANFGDKYMVTVSGGRLVTNTIGDSNKLPPSLVSSSEALFKYGILLTVQLDPLNKNKNKNYIGTVLYAAKGDNSTTYNTSYTFFN